MGDRYSAINLNRTIYRFQSVKVSEDKDILTLQYIIYNTDGSVDNAEIDICNPFKYWNGKMEYVGDKFSIVGDGTKIMCGLTEEPTIYSYRVTRTLPPLPLKITLKELEEKFGRPVEIIKEKNEND